jgi:regulatory protein
VAILDRFTEVGLIDDAAFAAAWVESRQSGRGLSRRALAHELRKKGVADETIAEALESVDADDERAAAEGLVARKLPVTRSLPTEARVRRLTGMLARKGYSPGLAFAVVREAIESEGCELADD